MGFDRLRNAATQWHMPRLMSVNVLTTRSTPRQLPDIKDIKKS